MIHGRVAAETASSRWMLGRAMFAMVSSRTSISCAVAMTSRDRPSPRPPGEAPGWPVWYGRHGELLEAGAELRALAYIAWAVPTGRPNAASAIHTAMATIIRFSVSETNPRGTLLDPPTQAHLSSRLSM